MALGGIGATAAASKAIGAATEAAQLKAQMKLGMEGILKINEESKLTSQKMNTELFKNNLQTQSEAAKSIPF